MPKVIEPDFADHYTRLHNLASKEYTVAFKKVGAKMWHDDKAHPLKQKHTDFIRNMIKQGYDKSNYNIVRPLTVLDSHSHITADQLMNLKSEVDSIHKKYTTALSKYR